MKLKMMRLKGIILLLVLLFFGQLTYSQKLSEAEYELERDAIEFFKEKKYDIALPMFSSLLSVRPQEGFYNYCYGICLVEVNKDIPKAIEYLKFASGKDVKYFVFFYLGKANHLLYKFDEAIKNYNIFLQKGGDKDAEEYPAARYIVMCKNGKDLIQYISNLMVIENKTLRNQDFFYSYNLGDFGGKIVIKPKEFKTKFDQKRKEKGIMFMTNSNFVYYGSYGKNGKNGKDIYRSHRLPDGLYSEPEWLGDVINTSFDEDYPFLHPDGKTLYFCSKGHNSMGGYDIFRTVYDTVRAKWSKPENLDFPTNSPYDDLLYISDENEDFAYFASSRETDSEEISIYKIKIDKNPDKRELREYEEIINLSKLNTNSLADNNNSSNGLSESDGTMNQKSGTNKKELTFDKINFDPNLGFNDVVAENSKDIEIVDNQYKNLNKQSKVAYIAANEKNKDANKKWQEAISIYEVLSEITNADERDVELEKAIKLEDEANDLSKEAVVAFNLGSNLEKNAKEKEEELKNLLDLKNSLNENGNIEEMVDKINNRRELLNLAEEKYTSSVQELEQRKSTAKLKQDELDIVKEERIHNENVIKSIDNDIAIINNQLKTEKKTDIVADLNSQLADLNKEKQETEVKRNNLSEQEEKLKVDVREMKKELVYLDKLTKQADATNIADNNLDEKLSKVNKENLDKEIFDKELAADLNKAKEMADNISDNSISSDNNTNQNNNSDNNLVIDKNTEDVVETYNNPVAQKLFREARQNKMLSDSLINQADTKRKLLETIDDKEQRRVVENEIVQLETQAAEEKSKGNNIEAEKLNNEANSKRNLLVIVNNIEERNRIEKEISELEELSAIKKQQAVSKFTEAQFEENNYVADINNNSINKTNNNSLAVSSKDSLLSEIEKIEDNPKFPFSESENDTDLDKYQKELFKANYYLELNKTIEPHLVQMKGSVDTISDTQTKEHYQKEIVRLENILERSKEKSIESIAKAEKLKPLVNNQLDNTDFSNEELLVKATSYQPTIKLNYTSEQEKETGLITENRNLATDNYNKYTSVQKDLKELENRLEKSDDTKEKKTLETEIEEKKRVFDNNFQSYSKLSEQSNQGEYNLYNNMIEDVRIVNSNKDVILANNLVKEAGLYYEKASLIRANANMISDKEDQANQIHKADLMERVAINKMKHATDLYLLNSQTATADNNANKNPENSNIVKITLTPEEEEKLKESRKNRYEAEIEAKEAEKTLEEIEIKKQKAEVVYSEKEKKKILKGIEEKENNANKRLMAAYLRYKTADSVKYYLNRNQIIQISKSLSDIGSNKPKAGQYAKEADFYFNNAQKRWTEASGTKEVDEKIKTMKSAVAMENQALESQVFALDLLINSENTLFVASNSLTKVDLSSMNTPVNVDDVIKIGTHRIIENIELPDEELKAMDKTTEIEDVAINLRMDVVKMKKQLAELQNVVETSGNKKDIKKAEKEIEKVKKSMFASQFTEVELYGNVNNTRYYIYQDYIKTYRIKGTSNEARQGRQLESDARAKFNKAQSLRERAFMEQDPNKAYAKAKEAMDLEKNAIIDLEKAYSIYLGLKPLEEEIAEFQKNRIIEKNENALVVKSLADITPIDIDTMSFNHGKSGNNDTNLADNNSNNVDSTDTTNLTADNNSDNTNPPDTTNLTADNTNNTDNTNPPDTTNLTADNTNNTDNTNPPDTTNLTADNTNNSDNTNNNNSVISKTIEGTNVVIPAQAIFKFSIQSNKTNSASNPIPFNEELPAGIVFKIQIGAFKTPIPDNTFEGLNPVSADKLPNSTFIKYLVGLFQTYEAAGIALNDVKNKGYRDAFIVAYKGGKRISLFEARNLINKESPDVKQFYDAVALNESEMVRSGQTGNTTANNSTTNTNNNSSQNNNNNTSVDVVKAVNMSEVTGLLYTVQIGVYKTAVTKKDLFNLDPIYQETTNNGLIRYTTGIFNSTDAANSEKDKIVRIGIRDAFVTAYYDGKRISISEAARISASGSADFADSKNTNSGTIPVDENSGNSNVNTSVSNKIEFKVQIGAYKEQVPTNVVKSLLEVSAQQGLDQQIDDKGFTIYTVGNYTNYDEAKISKESMSKGGIPDAFVVAFNNGKKISVEEALRLIQ